MCQRRRKGGGGRVRVGLASPEEFDETVFEVGAGGDDTVERIGPDDEYAFIALSEVVSKKTRTLLATYDESGTLVLFCTWEVEHGIKDLDTGVDVDIDGLVLWRTADGRCDHYVNEHEDDVHCSKGGMYGCAPDLDGDDWVESSNSGLKRFQGGILVWKDAKLGDGVVDVRDAESNAGGDVLLVGAEPGIALGLAEQPVEESVVPVVVHGRAGQSQTLLKSEIRRDSQRR